MMYVNADNWQSEVLQSDKPVVVDFFATWCGPCKLQGPILDGLAEEFDHFKIVKCDVDEAPMLADQCKIRVVPTLVLFKDGAMVKKNEGVLRREDFLSVFGL